MVAIQDAFTVSGEKLRFPGDPQGSPGNTISCRCTVLPVIEAMGMPEDKPIGAVPQFTSLKEAEEWLTSSGLAQAGTLQGVALNDMQQIAEHLWSRREVIDKITDSQGLASFTMRSFPNDRSIAWVTVERQGMMVNSWQLQRHPKYGFTNYKNSYYTSRKAVENGHVPWSVGGYFDSEMAAFLGDIDHELGHVLMEGIKERHTWNFSGKWGAAVRRARQLGGDYISRYAMKDASEHFSEVFSAVLNGKSMLVSDPLVAFVNELLEAQPWLLD